VVENSLQEHISAHFHATQELYVQTGAHHMSSNYFDAILEEAGAFSLLGEVPLTVIGSDTMRRALHPGLGIYSPACGPTPLCTASRYNLAKGYLGRGFFDIVS
jgi:hypothetical protein